MSVTIADPEQVILEAIPHRRLAYTWTYTPGWAEAVGFDRETLAKLAAEPRSRVTFDIEVAGPLVMLTVVHEGFELGSTALVSLSEGWPRLLSDLKTLLETGEILPVEGAVTARAPA